MFVSESLCHDVKSLVTQDEMDNTTGTSATVGSAWESDFALLRRELNLTEDEMDNTTGTSATVCSALESDFALLRHEIDWRFNMFMFGILAYFLLLYFTALMRELVRHFAGNRYRDNDDDDDDHDA